MRHIVKLKDIFCTLDSNTKTQTPNPFAALAIHPVIPHYDFMFQYPTPKPAATLSVMHMYMTQAASAVYTPTILILIMSCGTSIVPTLEPIM